MDYLATNKLGQSSIRHVIAASGAIGKSTFLRKLVTKCFEQPAIIPIYIDASAVNIDNGVSGLFCDYWESVAGLSCTGGLIPKDADLKYKKVVLIVDELERATAGFVNAMFNTVNGEAALLRLENQLHAAGAELSVVVATRDFMARFAGFEKLQLLPLELEIVRTKLGDEFNENSEKLNDVLRSPLYLWMHLYQQIDSDMSVSEERRCRQVVRTNTDLLWNYHLFDLQRGVFSREQEIIITHVIPMLAFNMYHKSVNGEVFIEDDINETIIEARQLLAHYNKVLPDDIRYDNVISALIRFTHEPTKGNFKWDHMAFFEYLVARHIFNIGCLLITIRDQTFICQQVHRINSLHNPDIEALILDLFQMSFDGYSYCGDSQFIVDVKGTLLGALRCTFHRDVLEGIPYTRIKYCIIENAIQYVARPQAEERAEREGYSVMETVLAFVRYIEEFSKHTMNYQLPHEAYSNLSRHYWRGSCFGEDRYQSIDYCVGFHYAQMSVKAYVSENTDTECRAFNSLAKSVNAILDYAIPQYVHDETIVALPFLELQCPNDKLADAYLELENAQRLGTRKGEISLSILRSNMAKYAYHLHRFVNKVLDISIEHGSSESLSLLAMLEQLQYEAGKADVGTLHRSYEHYRKGGMMGKVKDYCNRQAALVLGQYAPTFSQIMFDYHTIIEAIDGYTRQIGRPNLELMQYINALAMKLRIDIEQDRALRGKLDERYISQLKQIMEVNINAALLLIEHDRLEEETKQQLITLMLTPGKRISISGNGAAPFFRERWRASPQMIKYQLEIVCRAINTIADNHSLCKLFRDAQDRIRTYDYFFYLDQ